MHHEGLFARLRRAAVSAGLVFACLGLGGLAAPAAGQTAAPNADAKLDNATCLTCHDGKKGKLEVPTAAGKPRALHVVDPQKFQAGVHARMECVACHTDIRDNAEKGNAHAKDPAQPLKKVDCASCHQELWEQTVKRGRAEERPRLGVVAKNIEAYRKSFHARPNPDDKTKPNASCSDCHDTHSFNVPAKNTPEYTQFRLGISANCGTCHTDQLETYQQSVHGQENAKKMLADAAVCSDCHTAHAVAGTSSDPFKLTVTAQCGECHSKQFETYKDTFHGKVSTLGYAYTAKCFDCHGSHDIVRVDNPESKVHVDNRLETCRSCHNPKKGLADVSKGFVSFQPHADPHDFNRYPQVWAAWQLMSGLLVGTFGFFWLHTILWFYREWKERKARGGGHLHVRLDEVPAQLRGKQYQRFTATWRIAHLMFALSLMVLTLTGMPLFYPDVPWAPAIMKFFGGPKVTGVIHRTAAVIFAGIFFWHLVYMVIRIGRNWRTFEIFGPNSMVPNLKDLQDILGMFRWFFGKGPRPTFDRWTYWEKFDYWAPFWGVTIIGVSGLVMWLPGFFATFLPGWIFNVASIFHGEEAFLAVVFLFTVHFFNNHFRPDKFPVDVVMFTGSVPLEEFKKEHALEYDRLVASGELERHLVEAPSGLRLKLSKVLGFTLIAFGLTLLTLVAIGFFFGG